jgi:hypothetical protein
VVNKVAAHWAVGVEEEEWEEDEGEWEEAHRYQEAAPHYHPQQQQQQHMMMVHPQHQHEVLGAMPPSGSDADAEEVEEDVTAAGNTGSGHFDCEDEEDGQHEEEEAGDEQWPSFSSHVPVVPGVAGGGRLVL